MVSPKMKIPSRIPLTGFRSFIQLNTPPNTERTAVATPAVPAASVTLQCRFTHSDIFITTKVTSTAIAYFAVWVIGRKSTMPRYRKKVNAALP